MCSLQVDLVNQLGLTRGPGAGEGHGAASSDGNVTDVRLMLEEMNKQKKIDARRAKKGGSPRSGEPEGFQNPLSAPSSPTSDSDLPG